MEGLVDFPSLRDLRIGERRSMNNLNEYVKVAEAANLLGVSQNTLRTSAEPGRFVCDEAPRTVTSYFGGPTWSSS
jgi:hypothetical protein